VKYIEAMAAKEGCLIATIICLKLSPSTAHMIESSTQFCREQSSPYFHSCFSGFFCCCVVHLQDLVSSNDLGVAIQQETPQLLMEGDTLDDHVSLDDQANCHDQAALDSLDTICVGAQEETVNSLCDQNSIMELLLSTTDTAHDNDVDQLSVHSSLGSSASFTSSYDVMDHRNTNVDHVTTPSDHVTTSSGHVTTSKAHVITPTQQIALPNLCTHTDKNGISLAMNFTETSAIPSSCTSHTDSSAGTHLSSSLVSSSSVSIPYAVTLYAASTVPCSIVVPLSNCRYVSATSSHCSTQCSNIPVPYTSKVMNVLCMLYYVHCTL